LSIRFLERKKIKTAFIEFAEFNKGGFSSAMEAKGTENP
jgi:hypothetical protein